jgi:hypothetical protein
MLLFTSRSGEMISRDEAYQLIVELNEDAYNLCYDDWVEADEMEDEDPDQAEEMREEASYNQAVEFREAFQSTLTPEQQEAILHYTKTDEDFAMEFNGWWGEE